MPISETVVKFFEEKGWKYSRIEDDTFFDYLLAFTGRNGKFQCTTLIEEDQGLFSFYSIYGSNAQKNKQAQMAELITRLNYGMIIGNFEMDFETGQIRLKTSIDFGGLRPEVVLIDHVIIKNIYIMDECIPCIEAVLFQNQTPEEAIKLITKRKEDLVE
jgi:hypothetical protein